MKKRNLTAIIIASSMMLTLAGCGVTAEPDSGNSNGSEVSVSSEAEAPEAEGTGGHGDPPHRRPGQGIRVQYHPGGRGGKTLPGSVFRHGPDGDRSSFPGSGEMHLRGREPGGGPAGEGQPGEMRFLRRRDPGGRPALSGRPGDLRPDLHRSPLPQRALRGDPAGDKTL